jgi:hypothetical protein
MVSALILAWSRTSLRAWSSTARAWPAFWAVTRRCVLVVDDAQFEGVPCANASGVGSYGGSACVHLLAMLSVCGIFGWLWQVELVLICNWHVTYFTVNK